MVRVFGDRYKGSMEEYGTYDASGVLWGYLQRRVGIFSGAGGIAMMDSEG